jgi:toxin ParE1/3/4
MSGFLLQPEAQADLDEIWLYVTHESGSVEIATRLIDAITERFWLLAQHPQIGRQRDHDLRPGLRSFPVGEYVIFYRSGGGRRCCSPCHARQPRHCGSIVIGGEIFNVARGVL